MWAVAFSQLELQGEQSAERLCLHHQSHLRSGSVIYNHIPARWLSLTGINDAGFGSHTQQFFDGLRFGVLTIIQRIVRRH